MTRKEKKVNAALLLTGLLTIAVGAATTAWKVQLGEILMSAGFVLALGPYLITFCLRFGRSHAIGAGSSLADKFIKGSLIALVASFAIGVAFALIGWNNNLFQAILVIAGLLSAPLGFLLMGMSRKDPTNPDLF